MSDHALDELAGALPDLERHAPQWLDGRPIAATLAPPDADALSRALREINAAGLAAVPRGGGQHLRIGNPPARADLFLSTQRLDGVEVMEPAEGVCRAAAGTRLGELRRAAAVHGAELPIDGPDAATVGGALAAASVGPRSHVYGRARDAVLGLDVVLASGEATRCGGRVVKNVTGYDLAKLYTGSLGTLGVITAAWLRMRPEPETRQVRTRRFADTADAADAARTVARRGTVRVCALRWDGQGLLLVLELGGDAAAVSGDAEACGGEPADVAEIAALEAQQWQDCEGLRVRIAALPSQLEAVMQPLREAGGDLLVYPGPGLVYARFAAEAVDAGAAAARSAAAAASGPLRFEQAPAEWKRDHCVFGAREPEVALYRALKQRFDPSGALSPGRFAGRI